jgi:hypothetical protein
MTWEGPHEPFANIRPRTHATAVKFGHELNSAPLYPVNLSGGGIPVNLVLNKTPE